MFVSTLNRPSENLLYDSKTSKQAHVKTLHFTVIF